MKRLGLLICDEHDDEFIAKYGTYDRDFIDMLEAVMPGYWEYRIWHCQNHELPLSPSECDAWIISGSRAAAYDKDTWVESLKQFVQQLDHAGASVLGICFGHQLIHSALGGDVEKYYDGWGLGAYPVSIVEDLASLKASDTIRVLAMHQDQVITCAPHFSVIGTSHFCQHAITLKGHSILTFQAHPEFTDELFASICSRIRPKAGEQRVDSALVELGKPDDRIQIRQLVADFLAGEVHD